MSPFDPFRGGGAPKGDNVPFFYRFFYRRASLILFCLLSSQCKESIETYIREVKVTSPDYVAMGDKVNLILHTNAA